MMEKKELVAKLEMKNRQYKEDFGLWLEEQVITMDETRQEKRRWPNDKEYLKDIAWVLQNVPRIAFPKSRRMMLSWILLAYSCWKLRYESGHASFWQSETFAKAAFSLSRIPMIEDNLKIAPLRKNYTTRAGGDDGIAKITYSHPDGLKSWMLAVCQGATVLNAYTVSFLILDECELQPFARQTMGHVMPLIESGVQVILCSSSNGPSGVLAEWMREINFLSWKDRP